MIELRLERDELSVFKYALISKAREAKEKGLRGYPACSSMALVLEGILERFDECLRQVGIDPNNPRVREEAENA